MAEEKRNFNRVSTKVIVHCRKDVENSFAPDYFLSFTKDISNQGARLVVPKEIKPGEHFIATLELPTSFIPVLTFSEAMWASKRGEGANIQEPQEEVGIKFLKMDQPDAEKLKSFIELKKEGR